MDKKAKKYNRLIKLIAIVGISFMLIFSNSIINKKVVIADSGFDSSYDSGGSDWGGSSDWGSSSSDWGSSSYYGGSGGGGGGAADTVISIIIFIIIIAIILGASSKSKPTPQMPTINTNDAEVENRIKQYIPNFDKAKFLEDGYGIYLAVQNAWMNFKLEDVKDVITDEMFNMYETQLATLEVKNQQNIMDGFVKQKACLKDVVKQNDNITITAYYVVDFYDYIIDRNTKNVLRGSKSNKIRITYEMKFRKTLNTKSVVENCPNCGAKLEGMNGAGTCKYCGSKIVYENAKWVLTDKKNVGQIRL